jgi:nitrite reductase/ring-hydroxylating ferredoxin subunit
LPRKKRPRLVRIASIRSMREGMSVKFALRREGRATEAFAFRKDGRFHAYLNLCRHWTVGLDLDDNDFFSPDGGWLVCKNHGAVYDPSTGGCASGPCGGASLYRVPVVEKEGILYAEWEGIEWGDGRET